MGLEVKSAALCIYVHFVNGSEHPVALLIPMRKAIEINRANSRKEEIDWREALCETKLREQNWCIERIPGHVTTSISMDSLL